MADLNEDLHRVLALTKAGEYEEALILVRGVLRRSPDNRHARVYRYTLEARLLEQELVLLYQKILDLHPENREARRKLARQLTRRGDSPSLAMTRSSAASPSESGVLRTSFPAPSLPTGPRQRLEIVASERPASVADAVGIERRTSQRFSLDVDVGLHSDSNFFTGYSDDLSKGGLFIATPNVLAMGTRLWVSFHLPAGPEIKTEVEVCWVHDPLLMELDGMPGMGVRFVGLNEEQLSAIHYFMARRRPMLIEE